MGDEFFIELTDLVSLHKSGEALILLDQVLREGKDAKQLMKDWNAHYRNLLITKFMRNPDALLNMSRENVEKVKEQSMHIGFDEIDKAILRISKTINEARWSTQPRILMELDIVALSGGKGSYMTEAVPRPVREEKPEPVKALSRLSGQFPALRSSEKAGDRKSPGHQSEGPSSGRARSRHEPFRDRGTDEQHQEYPRYLWNSHPAHRA